VVADQQQLAQWISSLASTNQPATVGVGKRPRRGFSYGSAVSRSGSRQPQFPGGDGAATLTVVA